MFCPPTSLFFILKTPKPSSATSPKLAITKPILAFCHYAGQLIRKASSHTLAEEACVLFLGNTSISPYIQALWKLHALSPPSAGRYALCQSHTAAGWIMNLIKSRQSKRHWLLAYLELINTHPSLVEG